MKSVRQLRNYQPVFELTPDPIVVARASDAKIVLVNKAFEVTTGLTPEQSIGRTPIELGLWPNPEECERCVRLLSEDGQFQNLPMILHTKNGDAPFLISAALVPFAGEDCFITIARNVTEIRKAEAALQSARAALASRVHMLEESQTRLRAEMEARERSELKFKTIFDANLDLLAINDLHTGEYVEVNEEWTRILGYSRDDILGRNDAELSIWQRNSLASLRALLDSNGAVRGYDADLRRKDGTPVPCLHSAFLTNLDGRDCWITVSRDISALRQAERKSQESEATLRRIIDTSLDSITVVRLSDHRFLNVNDAFLRALGYTRNELIGTPIGNTNILANTSQARAFRRALVADSAVNNVQTDLLSRDGNVIPFLSSSVVLDIEGERCAVTMSRDITEIKDTELKLIRAREEALAASAAKSEFLSSMSHEIRTPMNAIFGMIELLRRETLTSDQRRFLAIMKANSESLLTLLNDILDLAKIESGRLALNPVCFDLEKELDEIADVMSVRAYEKQLNLAVHQSAEVPKALIGDSLRLRQIVINLLGNAIKFTHNGEVSLTVVRDPSSEGKLEINSATECILRFDVKDSGIGIPADKLDDIFSSFEQGDSSTTRNYGGSGLGLAIARRLVALCGGTIGVKSQVGVGSCFTFTARFQIDHTERGSEESCAVLKGLSVLVVDDASVNRMIVRDILAAEGVEVCEATNATEVAELIQQGRRFSLALIDYNLPGSDGLAIAQQLRDADPNGLNLGASMIMLTSSDLSAKRAQLEQTGIQGYLLKPLKRNDLLKTVRRAIESSKTRQSCDKEAVLPDGQRKLEQRSPTEPGALRLLVTDDSAVNRLLIRELLSELRCEIIEASNGQEACDQVREKRFDAVIMDMRMPVMDGYAATQSIREWEQESGSRRTVIIALTASALTQDVKRCLEAGCDFYMSKPVSAAALSDLLTKALGQREVPLLQ